MSIKSLTAEELKKLNANSTLAALQANVRKSAASLSGKKNEEEEKAYQLYLAERIANPDNLRPKLPSLSDMNYLASATNAVGNREAEAKNRALGVYDNEMIAYNPDLSYLPSAAYIDSLLEKVTGELTASKEKDSYYEGLQAKYSDLEDWYYNFEGDPDDYDLKAMGTLVNGTQYAPSYELPDDERQKLMAQYTEVKPWLEGILPTLEYDSQTEALQARYNMLLEEQERRGKGAAYQEMAADLRSSPTFEADSQYTPATGESYAKYLKEHTGMGWFGAAADMLDRSNDAAVLYDYIMNPSYAKEYDAMMNDGYRTKGYGMLTGEEKAVLAAAYKQSPERFMEVLAALEADSGLRRSYLGVEKAIQENFATANLGTGALAWTGALASNVASGVMYPIQAGAAMLGYDDPYSDLYAPNRFTQNVRGAQSQVAGEALPMQVPFTNQKLGEFLYNGITSMADMGVAMGIGGLTKAPAKVMQLVMSSEAASNELQNDLLAGMDATESAARSIAAGAIEWLTEKYSIEALLADPKAVLGHIVKNFFTEASEEGASTLLNTVADNFISSLAGHETELKNEYNALLAQGVDAKAASQAVLTSYMRGLAGDVLLGAFTGGMLGSVSGAQTNASRASAGKTIAEAGNVPKLLDIAATMGGESGQMGRALKATRDNGGKISNRQVGRLYEAMYTELDGQTRSIIDRTMQEAVADRLVELGDDAGVAAEVAEAIVPVMRGEKPTLAQTRTMARSNNASQVIKELMYRDDTTSDGRQEHSAWARTADETGYNASAHFRGKKGELQAMGVDTRVTAKATKRAKVNAERLLAKKATNRKSMGAVDKAGHTFQVVKLAKNGGNVEVVVKGKDGEAQNLAADDVQLESRPVAEIVAYVEENAASMTEEQANQMLHSYVDGTSAQNHIADYQKAYNAGFDGREVGQLAEMDEAMARQVAEQGRKDAQTAEEARQKTIGAIATGRKGKVTFSQTAMDMGDEKSLKAIRDSLDEKRRMSITVLERIAKVTGINFVLYESKADAEGRYTAENGSYDVKSGTIRIDINSGKNSASDMAEFAILRTASHELTHFIEHNSREGYAKLREFVTGELTRRGKDFDQLVQGKLDSAMAAGEKLTRAGAISEVVADASELMLRDTRVIEQLAAKDKTLFGQVKAFVQSFVQKIRDAFAGVEAIHGEARTMMQELVEEFQQKWDFALVEAVEQAQRPDGEQMEADDEVKQYSLRNGPVSDSDVLNALKWCKRLDSTNETGYDWNYVPVRASTPKLILDDLDTDDVPMVMNVYKVRQALAPEGKPFGNSTGHGFTPREMASLFASVDNPNYFSFSKTRNNYGIVLEHNGAAVVLIISPPRHMNADELLSAHGGRRTVTVTMFSRDNVTDAIYYLEHGGYKERPLPAEAKGNHVPERTKEEVENSVSRISANVNPEFAETQKSLRNQPGPEIRNASGETLVEQLDDGTAVQHSLRSWTDMERETVRSNLINRGFERVAVDAWIDDVDGVARLIAADRDRLDFVAADNQVMLKKNQEYVRTLDASTLCAKRLLYQGTFNAIQHAMPNTPLTSDDLIDIRNMMAEHGHETPCGICYVESRRRNLGKFAAEWLEGYDAKGGYQPKIEDVTTTDGLEDMRIRHPEVYKSFTDEMKRKGSNNPKVVELRTDYRGDIRTLTRSEVRKILAIGGLRVQSFSDFETPHLLDMMQAVLDMAEQGLTSQAYTKVPNFAAVFGDTGIKINLSLIAEGTGLDEDGNLIFSSYEGMDFQKAMALRKRYSKNVGTILVGLSDEHIRAAMADPRIDYIIPFHRSGWGSEQMNRLTAMRGYTDYTDYQSERRVIGAYANGKLKTKKIGENLLPVEYWDFSKSGKENAETYLRLCAEDGRIPKFDQFLTDNGDGTYSLPADGSADGYWKLLIDYKMYDNDGVGSPQLAVKPVFNMEEARRVLAEYEGGANTLPVAQDVVQEFVSGYRQKSLRDMPADLTREYIASMTASDALNDVERDAIRIYGREVAELRKRQNMLAQIVKERDKAEGARREELTKRAKELRKFVSNQYDKITALERTTAYRNLVTRSREFVLDFLQGKSADEVAKLVDDYEQQVSDLDALIQAGEKDRVKERDMYLERIRSLRSDAAKKIMDEQERYRKMVETDMKIAKQNREAARLKDQIATRVKKLDKLRRHETDYKNIPEAFKPAVDELVGMFTSNFGAMVFDQKRAGNLATAYRQLKALDSNNNMDAASSFYDEDMEDLLFAMKEWAALDAELRESTGKSKDKTESGETTKTRAEKAALRLAINKGLLDTVDHFMAIITNAQDAFVAGKKVKFAAIGTEAGQALEARADKKTLVGNAGKALDTFDNLIRTGNLTPVYFFENLGNEAFSKMWGDLRKAERDFARTAYDAEQYIKKLREEYHYWSWVDTGKKANDELAITTEKGRKLTFTREQAMWLYATWKRENSNELAPTTHLTNPNGGIIYESRQAAGKGIFTTVQTKAAVLTETDIQKVLGWLTEEQKAYADGAVAYLSEDMAELGNAASMEMFGIRKYKERYYFPFQVAKEQLNQQSTSGRTSTTDDNRLKHVGFSHALTKGASKPLVMGDFSKVVEDHIAQMATYASFVVPIENMNRLMNYRFTADGESQTTIRSLLEQKYGAPAKDYIATLLQDLNGGVRSDDRARGFDYLIRAYKKGAVSASLSTAVQQWTSIFRAMAYISPKYVTTTAVTKRDWNELMKHSGTAVIKDMGRFDTNVGRTTVEWLDRRDTSKIKPRTKLKEAVNVKDWKTFTERWDAISGFLPGWFDQQTWAHLWNAVKREQADLHPEADVNSDEFLDMCGKRFDDIVTHTQVYDSVLAKSQLMRGKDGLTKMATSFAAEGTLTINMLYDAAANLKKPGGKAKAARVLAAVMASNMAAAAMKALITSWNDDDDERTVATKFVDSFLDNALDNNNPLTQIPIVKDIFSIFLGYDVERADMSVISDVVDAYNRLTSKNRSTWRKVEDLGGSLAKLFGLSFGNMSRDIRRAKNLFTSRWTAPSDYELSTALPWFEDKMDTHFDSLYEAMSADDASLVKDIRDYLTVVKGKSEKDIKAGAKEALGRQVKAGTLTKEQGIDWLLDKGIETKRKAAYGVVDEWVDKEANKDDETYEYSRFKDVMDAVLAGDRKALNAAKAEMKKNGGYDDDALYSGIRSGIKQLFLDGEISESKAKSLLTTYGNVVDKDGKTDQDEIYWTMEEWKARKAFTGDSEDFTYSKFDDFYKAVSSGRGVAAAVQKLLTHGTDKGDASAAITREFKDQLVSLVKAGKTREAAALQEKILDAYVALGYDREKKLKDVKKWYTK